MNFLQLCRAVATDSGTVAGVPNFTTVVGATGRVGQVVGWVRDAYIDIQNERSDWVWMRRDFTAPLTIDQIAYTPAQLGLDDVGSWLHDIPSEGWRNLTIYEDGQQDQEGELSEIPYSVFRERYQRGVHDHNKPTDWSISPTNQLLFGNKPDKAYIVRGEYMMRAEELAADADTPSMPAQFHRVIVQEALRLMSRADEAWQTLQAQAAQYDRLRNALVRETTPQMKFGGGTLA